MGGRANPEEDAGECPVHNVALLAVESQHKRNPLVYETCESCGGIWLDSADFAEEGDSAEVLIKGIVEFYREFALKLNPGTKAARSRCGEPCSSRRCLCACREKGALRPPLASPAPPAPPEKNSRAGAERLPARAADSGHARW